ncbi:MAG TPA: M48 family metallopeptidase, partial [Gammaproteobacteria bacterium]
MSDQRLIPLLLLLALLTGACSTTGIKDMTSSVTGMFGKGDRTEDLEGTMLQTALEDQGSTGAHTGSDPEAGWRDDINYWRYGDHTVAGLPQLEAYCNTVLDRVLTGWEGNPVGAHVYVSPENSFGAYTLPNGAIFVSLGTLKTLDSEDELAALLGHEASHLILEHHGSDSLKQASGWLSDAVQVYGRSGIGDQHDFARARAATWAIDKALFPAWARGQENEADALGTDLLVAAGYNADAMIGLLKKIETHTAQRQAWLDEQPQLDFTPDTGSTPEASAEQIKQQLVKLADEMGKNLEVQLAAEHDAAVERQVRVREYLRAKHLQRPRPAYQDASYAAALKHRPVAERIRQYGQVHEAERILLESSDIGRAAAVGAKALGGQLGEDPYTRMFMYRLR